MKKINWKIVVFLLSLTLTPLLIFLLGCLFITDVEHNPWEVSENGTITARLTIVATGERDTEPPLENPLFTAEAFFFTRIPNSWTILNNSTALLKLSGYFESTEEVVKLTAGGSPWVLDYVKRAGRIEPQFEVSNYKWLAGVTKPHTVTSGDSIEAIATVKTSGTGIFDKIRYMVGISLSTMEPETPKPRGSTLVSIASDGTPYNYEPTGLGPRWVEVDPDPGIKRVYTVDGAPGFGGGFMDVPFATNNITVFDASPSLVFQRSITFPKESYDPTYNIYYSNYYITGLSVDTLDHKIYASFQHITNQTSGKVYIINQYGNYGNPINIKGSNKPDSYGLAFQVIDVNPSNKKVYVINQINNSLTIIDGTTETISTVEALGIDIIPTAVIVNSPKVNPANYNNKAYVATLNGNLEIFDGNNNLLTTEAVGASPFFFAIDPNTNRVYLTNSGADSVSVISGEADYIEDTITVGTTPAACAVDSTNKVLYVSNMGSSNVSIIDLDPESSTYHKKKVPDVSVDKTPVGIVICGGNAFVGCVGDVFLTTRMFNENYPISPEAYFDIPNYLVPETWGTSVWKITPGGSPTKVQLDGGPPLTGATYGNYVFFANIGVNGFPTSMKDGWPVGIPPAPPAISLLVDGVKIINGDYISSRPKIEAILSDNSGVIGASLEVDGTPEAHTWTVNTPPALKVTASCTPSTPLNPSITHSIKAMTWDKMGFVTTVEVTGLKVQPGKATISESPMTYPAIFKPARGEILTLAYNLTASTDITVCIYSVGGEIVKTWRFGAGEMGGHVGYNAIQWNGVTDFGPKIGNGIYVYMIISENKILGKGKFVVYD